MDLQMEKWQKYVTCLSAKEQSNSSGHISDHYHQQYEGTQGHDKVTIINFTY